MKLTGMAVACALAACASTTPEANAGAPAGAMASPRLQCEFRLGAWCIAEGAYVVTRALAADRVHDRTWLLKGRFKPESELVVQEVNGCKSGYANELTFLSYESSVDVDGTSWDRLKVRLKSDGTCDLSILMSPFDGDPMEWAFSTGLTLLRGCKDEACTPLPLGDLKPQIEEQFRKQEAPRKN